MSPLRRWIPCLLVLMIGSVPSLVALSWDELLAERLEESVAYRQAALQRRQAELRVDQLDRFYVPYVSVGTAQPGPGIRYVGGEGGGFQPFSLAPSVSFTNVLGATVSLGLPITVRPDPAEGQDAFTVGDPTLSVSRRLFEETDAAALTAQAALIRARDAEAGAYADVRIGLITEVFDARSGAQTLADTRTRLDVARRLREAARDETVIRDLTRSILQAERAVIQAERALRPIDARVIESADELYAEILDRFDRWVAALPDREAVPEISPAIRAQQLTVAAADARRSLSFLPYVPNPTFDASLTYDRDANELSWSIGMRFSVPIVDRGERAVAALERRENAEIEALRLRTARDTFDRTVRTAWEELELLEIQARIDQLELEVQEDATERTRALYAEGFATEESLISSELALSTARLQVERTMNSYRAQQLRVLRFYETGM